MRESWRPVPGYSEQYWVSDLGRIRSFRRYPRGRLLGPGRASTGYWTVSFGRGNSKQVHALVLLAFRGPCPKGQEVRHKDGNRSNAKLSNLCYGTRSQNNVDASRHGRRRLSVAQAKYIKKQAPSEKLAVQLAKKFKISRGHLWNIWYGNCWVHA